MSHLEYYTRRNISPVRYDLSNLGAHFQRREALYRTLGLLPLTIRGAKVLEVAAGTGQNSLYLATLRPEILVLIEPNPEGVRSIGKCYEDLSVPHTKPSLIESRLEDYHTGEKFDVVICENWLGASAHERGLLRKLAGLVAPRGVLVVTCVSPVGFLPNIVRRALAIKLAGWCAEFDEKTNVIAEAFAPHLATLGSMTRNVVDWVHDNMLNPAYFDLCLTIPMVLSDLGQQFQAVGVSPDFRRDWRWFKAMHGAEFEFNHVLTEEYFRNCHRFLDYREVYEDRSPADNRELEDEAASLVVTVREYELTAAANSKPVITGIKKIRALLTGFASRAADALLEVTDLLERNSISATEVAQSPELSRWFGRETIYLSFEHMVDGPKVASR